VVEDANNSSSQTSSRDIWFNHAPVAYGDNIVATSTAFAIDGDHATLSLDNDLLLANDIDADEEDSAFISSVYPTQPGHGSVSQPNFGLTDYVLTNAGDLPTGSGPPLTDNFTYAASDGHWTSNAATVNLTVVAAQSMEGGPVATLLDTSANNILFGGAVQGADTFVFAATSGHDTIVNFEHDTDKIDLIALGIEVDNRTWLTEHSNIIGGDTLIHLDTPTHDTILVKGVTSLTGSDFILHPYN
jgi:hypothetical protein